MRTFEKIAVALFFAYCVYGGLVFTGHHVANTLLIMSHDDLQHPAKPLFETFETLRRIVQ